MPVYGVDIKVWATAYIKAATPEEALAKLQDLASLCIELPEAEFGDVEVSGRRYDDPDLPEVSLAPMMTIDADAIRAVPVEEMEERG